VSASSALILAARAFRARLEPLIPSLRKARRETCFPAAVSLLAIRRAWSISGRVGPPVLPAVSWTAVGAVLVLAGGPAPDFDRAALWSWAGPAWSPADQPADRGAAGPAVPAWSGPPVVV
jgi:hypothetical protein